MTQKRRVLSAALFSLFAAAGATSAQAQQFTNLYVFGDSLSDTGYYRPFLTAAGVPASLVATLGRFTTNPGPIWAEVIAANLGVSALPSNVAGGTVYAQGGARVALPSGSTPPGGAQRPVSTQVTEFLSANNGAADPNALYGIWAGANDIFQNLALVQAGQITVEQLSANIQAAAGAEVQQIARLQAAGARHVLVFNLPNIGATPQFANAGAAIQGQVTQLSAGYNTALFAALAGAGINVIPVDTFTLISEVMANPSAYGITNTTGVACGPLPPFSSTPNSQFCYSANLVTPDAANTYAFADGVHPTTASHQITADLVMALLSGPTQMSLMPESALAVRSANITTLRNALAAAPVTTKTADWSVFVAGADGDFDIDSGAGTVGASNGVRTLTIGALARVSESFSLGASYAYNEGEATFGGDGGGYKTADHAFSLFGGAYWSGAYVNAALSIGNINWNNVRRNIGIGTATRVAEGRTDGSNASAYVGGGYDFMFGNFSVGPLAGVLLQNVEMNGFEESGAGSASLKYGKFTRRSEVWSLGGRASVTLGNWTPWVRVTADKERRDDERLISATPMSMISTNNSYSLPGYQPDTSFITSNLGVNGRFEKFSVGIAYYNVSKREGQSEDGFTASVAVRF